MTGLESRFEVREARQQLSQKQSQPGRRVFPELARDTPCGCTQVCSSYLGKRISQNFTVTPVEDSDWVVARPVMLLM